MAETDLSLPMLRCSGCGKVGHLVLWSKTPHSLNESPLRWPVECHARDAFGKVCGQMRLSSHRAVRALVAKVAHLNVR